MRWVVGVACGVAVTVAGILLEVPVVGHGGRAQEGGSQVEARSLVDGSPLGPRLSPEARATAEANLAAARRDLDAKPQDAEALIWYGRRLGYLQRYRDAIEVFTRAIALHPRDARAYRHRGHRYISVREFTRAIADLDRAAALITGAPDEIEPDGAPNARNIPTSTLHGNIYYHLGLAHYLTNDMERAVAVYRTALGAPKVNVDTLVSTSNWLYMALRRLGRRDEAARVLVPISASMDVIENQAYHRLLLFYKGDLSLEALAGGRVDRNQDDATLYGIGNWHLYNGRRDEARAVFERLVAMPNWPSFAHIAAEADLARMKQR